MPHIPPRSVHAWLRALLPWSLVAAGTVAAAPPGAQFQINGYTTGDQQDPRAAALSNGQFVVVWDSEGSTGGDDSSYSVQARILDATGAPIGAAFQVNTETEGAQVVADVDARGEDFVVVWQTRDGDGQGIAGRRYSSAAQPVGAEFPINTYTTDHQSRPAVAMMDSRRFLVAWDGFEPTSVGVRVRARVYDEVGVPVGLPFNVDGGVVLSPVFAQTSARGDDEFLVVWHGRDQSLPRGIGSSVVLGRRVGSDGSLLGAELRLSEASFASSTQPAVAVAPLGGFFAAWSGFFIPGDPDEGILVRRFAQDGAPVGPAQAANQLKPGDQDFPELAVGPDGWLLLAWLSRPGGAPATIRGRFFSTVAPVAGPEFQVNTVEGYQLRLRVAWPATGDPLVVWTSGASAGNDDDGLSVQGRIVAAPIFADGFEAGTPTGWSTSVGASAS